VGKLVGHVARGVGHQGDRRVATGELLHDHVVDLRRLEHPEMGRLVHEALRSVGVHVNAKARAATRDHE
jgi:hypothetical protein